MWGISKSFKAIKWKPNLHKLVNAPQASKSLFLMFQKCERLTVNASGAAVKIMKVSVKYF